MKKRHAWVLALAPLLVPGACHDATAPIDEDLTPDDAVSLALGGDLESGTIIEGQLAFLGLGFEGQNASPSRRSVGPRTRDCPAGGTVTVWGEVGRVDHGEGVVEFSMEGHRRRSACAHQRRAVRVEISSTGAPAYETLEAYRKKVNGRPTGPQTTHYSGEFDWVKYRGDQEVKRGHCTFDVSSERRPDAGKRKVWGVICGREFSREVSWRRGT